MELKIFKRYIINRFLERTNKKVTLRKIILRVIKENQRTIPYTLFYWKKYKHKNYFYRHSSTWLDGNEKFIEKNGRYY